MAAGNLVRVLSVLFQRKPNREAAQAGMPVQPKRKPPKLSRAKVYRASEKPEALFYGEASAEGGNPVTMSISF